jgi:OOP family OmpA-OmpF porin
MRRGLIAAGAALLLPVAALAASAAASVTLDGNRLVVPQPLQFRPGTSILQRGSDGTLARVATWLSEKAFISVLRIEGHTLPGPKAQGLSETRAMAVAARLVAMGVDCRRLIVVGFGDTKPVAAPGSLSNERIEFVNAALRGRAIGGMPLDGGGRQAGDACAVRPAR